MTDRRATDHTYGHLGEATYDTVEKKWSFSRTPVLPSIIRPIQPLQPCIPPSAQSKPEAQRNATDRASNRARDQKRSLIREIPQIGAAVSVLGPLVRTAAVETSKTRPTGGDLVASGTAKVLSKHHGDRLIQVLAVAHGEAGHVLRLIKPRLEEHTWDRDDSVKLRLLNPSTSEDGYWLDGAGSIEQIVFSSGVEGDRSWLAVRKLASTTILQPVYQRIPGPARVPPGFQDKYRPSLLDPNPAVTITSAMTNGRNHADVAFNPWYPRQFAVLDEEGYWSAWDIEGRKRAGSKMATPGKSGYILDDRAESDLSLDIASNGWGRILWAGNVSTIVVCNDRHLAVFDLKAHPIRLRSPDLVPSGSFGRILEVKRSPLQHDKVFVLTNTRIFLLQINTAGEWLDDTDRTAGARIIMSCLHYREAQGNLLKLELHEEGDVCTAFLVSSGMFLVNVYKFTTTPDAATPVTWSTDSFSLEHGADEDTLSKLVGFCVLPATLERTDGRHASHMERDYLDHGNFLQAFALGENLEISQTLTAECRMVAAPVPGKPARYEQVTPPSESQAAPPEAHFLSSRTIDDFVVPDGFEDYESGSERKAPVVRPSIEDDIPEEPAPKVIDAQRWYELATKGKTTELPSQEDYHDVEIEMADYIQNIVGGIQHRRQAGLEGLSSFHDLAGFEKFTEDVDDGAALLQDFINNFEDNYAESSMAVTLQSSGLLRMLDLQPDESYGDSLPNLSNVYDRLVNLWVTSLPQNTPGMARIAKEKVVRNVAADLCLSSILVSIRDKSVPLPSTAPPQDLEEGPSLTLPIHGGRPPSPRTPSRSRFSSQPLQDHGFEPSSSYATPAPSESALSGEPAEDPAVARLRGFALSIKSLKPLGPTCASILAQWPETPGSDPSTYVWRPGQISGAAGEEEGDSDEEAARQREEKRRRRTEKFLKRQKGVASPRLGMVQSSQPPPVQSSQPPPVMESQPAYRFAASQVMVPSSSQADGGFSMTQPSAGAFGSRAGVVGKKKKRKTGF
ncbi:hypothetical protein VE02_06308 [Pseudogymnoascus sp. 03VT05]|nr:hypothetical protein VE02_06308 [Pseudogymnoascus sp. 03VT05]